MSECEIDDRGLELIAEGIAANSTLTELDITGNEVEIAGMRFLVDAVLGNYSLMKIEWQDNPFVEDDTSQEVAGTLSDFLERNKYYSHNILMKEMAALLKDPALL